MMNLKLELLRADSGNFLRRTFLIGIGCIEKSKPGFPMRVQRA